MISLVLIVVEIVEPVPVVGRDRENVPAAATASNPLGSELLVSTPSIE